MEEARLIAQDLYGAQDRINANIRRAFDFVLSRKGMQRPPVTDESRFVGLEFALQFYETVRVRCVILCMWCCLAENETSVHGLVEKFLLFESLTDLCCCWLIFYALWTEQAPAGQELLSDSSSAERQRGRSEGASEVEYSDPEEGGTEDDDEESDGESESSLDLQGEHFEEFAAATLSYFKRDGCVAYIIVDDPALFSFPSPALEKN